MQNVAEGVSGKRLGVECVEKFGLDVILLHYVGKREVEDAFTSYNVL